MTSYRRVTKLEERVQELFARQRVKRVLVACSGGADSFALLHAATQILSAPGQVMVATINHGLRPEAEEECDVVCQWAHERNIPAEKFTLAAPPKNHAEARHARYAALGAIARRRQADVIAVGHTATDQVETFFQRLLSGASTRGLGAMRSTRPVAAEMQLLRPLLQVTRAETESYAAAHKLPFVSDPSNRDRHYFRNRLRQDLLPLLAREMPDFENRIGQLCQRLQADEEFLDREAERAAATLTQPDGTLLARDLGQLPVALASRVLLQRAPLALSAKHVTRILAYAATSQGTRDLTLPGGWAARFSYGTIDFCRPSADLVPAPTEIPVAGPGTYAFLHYRVSIAEKRWNAITKTRRQLVLRNVRPGDRLTRGKVQDLFVNRRVPRPLRRTWPLLVGRDLHSDQEKVVWVPRAEELELN